MTSTLDARVRELQQFTHFDYAPIELVGGEAS